jgi:uncharacterized protein YxjI
MHPDLSRNLFFVKEAVRLFRASNEFDVLDPATGHPILHCREPHLGGFTKLLRFTDYKRMTPFDVRVTTPDGAPVLTVKRGVSFFRSNVDVLDERGVRIGGFRQRFFSIGGKFDVVDAHDQPVCMLQGKWTGWEFKFLRGDRQIALVTKKWAGLGKELFTSADNYVLSVADDLSPQDPARQLILAAVLCIDMVLKE